MFNWFGCRAPVKDKCKHLSITATVNTVVGVPVARESKPGEMWATATCDVCGHNWPITVKFPEYYQLRLEYRELVEYFDAVDDITLDARETILEHQDRQRQ